MELIYKVYVLAAQLRLNYEGPQYVVGVCKSGK
jgi:hypothetical protein